MISLPLPLLFQTLNRHLAYYGLNHRNYLIVALLFASLAREARINRSLFVVKVYKIRRYNEIRSYLESRLFIRLVNNKKKKYRNKVISRMLVDYLNI